MTSTTTQDFDQLLQRYLDDAKSQITKMAVLAFFGILLLTSPMLFKFEVFFGYLVLPVGIKIEFVWLLIFPIAAALYVGRGLNSVLLAKQRAVNILKSVSPTKMSVTGISRKFLFWNSESSPGYKLDLAPLKSAAATIQKLNVDPASKVGVERMAALQAQFEQARETSGAPPTIEVDVYFDDKQLPVALVHNGELVWAAYWW